MLDNCEHLAGEGARLVVDLLDRIPALRVVATGRSPLGPLAAADAVMLLTDRIRAGRPGWFGHDTDRRDLRRLAPRLVAHSYFALGDPGRGRADIADHYRRPRRDPPPGRCGPLTGLLAGRDRPDPSLADSALRVPGFVPGPTPAVVRYR